MATNIETLELKILANATSAKLGLDALTSSLNKLKNATKGGLGLPAVSKEVGGLDKAMKQMNKSNNKEKGAFTDLFHVMKSGARTISRLGKSLWSAIDKSSDYTENVNLFNVAMGEYANESMAYAEKVSEAMGIDTSDWIRSQGVFMTLATGFGVAGERASVMSKNLTQLGYDLASFYNLDTEDAMQKLQSGLAGELEPLRRIGYDLSQAKLEATALELGIDKTLSSMTQAEKAQLRYYAIMTQVTEVQGDMARTLDDPANQIRVLKAEVNMAAREIGNVFIPALNALLPYLIAGAKAVGSMASRLAGLFGNKKQDASEPMSKVVENTDAVTANLEDAQKEAKKLKSYMLGIDELNVLNPNEGSTEDSSGWVDFKLPEYNFLDDAIESKVSDLTAGMEKLLWVVGAIGGAFALWKIGSGVLTFVDKLPTTTKMLKAFTTGLKAFGVGAIITGAVAGAAYLISLTDDTMTKIGAIISAGFLAVGAILAFTGNLPLGIALMAVGAVAMGSAIAMNTTALSDEVKNVIGLITGIVSGALLAVGAILAFSGVSLPIGIALMLGGALAFATAVAPNWNGLSDTVKGVISAIMAVVGAALLVLGIILLFTGAGIPLGIGLILAGAASLAAPVALNWNFLVDMFKGIWDKVTAWWNTSVAPIFTKEWWQNLFAKCMEGIKTSFKNGINWVIDKLNWLINKINSILGAEIKMPDWLGGGTFSLGIKIPLIPQFAEGGFPEQGQMFIAREAGAEMVGNIGRRTAVANNDQIVGGIASGVATANEEQNALLREQNSLLRAILEKDSGVYLDGKNLTNSVEKYQRERGRVLVTGGVI